MPDFILYLIKANLAILLCYAGYHLLLRRLTFYTLNRYYLLFTAVFSAGYPLLNIDELWSQHNPLPPDTAIVITGWQQFPEASFSIWPYIQALFFLVVVFFSIRFLFRLASLRQIHLRATPAVWQRYRYFQTEENVSPFSFWKYIYLHPPRHKVNEMNAILEHEQVHVDQLHSIDVLMAEACTILFWFNPFAWLLRRAVCENLEFITDQKVLQSGLDTKSYQYELLKSLSQHQPQLGNSFTFKTLKNRIIMMNKKKSSQFQLGKYVLLVPLVIVLVSLFTLSRANKNMEIQANKEREIPTNTQTKMPTEVPTKIPTNKQVAVEEDINNKTIDTIPSAKTHTLEEVKVRSKETVGENPLYVIDGIPQKDADAKNLSPERIQSISVLKDSQATALYGDKGKNGVIVVTTKKGQGLSETQYESGVKAMSIRTIKDTSSFSGADSYSSAEPRIFLDGKEVDKATLSRLDPNKIKAIDIQKAKIGDRGTMRITMKD